MPINQKKWKALVDKLVCGGLYIVNRRGCGKSTAILEACRQIGVKRCVIVVKNMAESEELHQLWVRHFSVVDPCPMIVCGYSAGRRMTGRPERVILVDNYFHAEYFGPFFAAVSTPHFRVEVVDL